MQITPWWQSDLHFIQDFRPVLRACERLIAIADMHDEVIVENSRGAAVFEEFAKATKTFSSIIALASSGYGQQAFMLSGSLFESCMCICWAIKNSEMADEYADLHARLEIEIHAKRERSAGLAPASDTAMFEDDTERIKAETLFGKDAERLWTGHSTLSELVKEVSLSWEDKTQSERLNKAWFGVSHWLARTIARGTGLANRAYRISESEAAIGNQKRVDVSPAPGIEYTLQALHFSSYSFLLALDSHTERFRPHLAGELKNAYGLLWRSSKSEDQLRTLQDEDPCPCDTPGTIWASCHKWTNSLGSAKSEIIRSDEFETAADIKDIDAASADALNSTDYSVEVVIGDDKYAEPVIATFTCKLPFTLGMTDDGEHQILIIGSYSNQDRIAYYGRQPYVTLRLHNHAIDGYQIWPESAGGVLNSFYGEDPFRDLSSPPAWGQGQDVYEQWVTLETPQARLDFESENDAAYTFHRCIHALNLFLSAHNLAVGHLSVHPVATQDLKPLVFVGHKTALTGRWQYAGIMLMHAEALPYALAIEDATATADQLSAAVAQIIDQRPFIAARSWNARALRAALQRGDYTDGIVSMHTSMESMVFDLWKLLLLELGKSPADVEQAVLNADSFKYVITNRLPNLLGGTWDVTLAGRPAGEYWTQVYEVRGRIVHAGFEPNAAEFEKARNAFKGFNEYIEELLWRKRRKFPRTFFTKMGEERLRAKGWFDTSMKKVADLARSGDQTWPW